MSDVHEVGKRGRGGRIGTILREKWRVDARLGTGGMAAVYSATHYRNGNRVALKILHAEQSRDTETRTRFLREGYVANAVNHPGVVRVLDDDVTEDGCAFIVLELLEGESAEARRERMGGRLSLQEVLHIGDRLLDVLAAAHEQKIIHRDVKPENIFLTNDGNVKLLDFGIARMRGAGGEQTKTGVMLGTPDFMSPEQAGGRSELDGRTDVYLTGATIFTLLSGQRVHMGETIRDQLFQITTMRARSLSTAAPNVPLPIVRVVDKALELEMQDRWPTAKAMQEALRKAAIDVADRESGPTSVTLTVAIPIDSVPISTPPTPLLQPGIAATAMPSPIGSDPDPPPSPNSDGPTIYGPPDFDVKTSPLMDPLPVMLRGGPTGQLPPGFQAITARTNDTPPASRPSGTRTPSPYQPPPQLQPQPAPQQPQQPQPPVQPHVAPRQPLRSTQPLSPGNFPAAMPVLQHTVPLPPGPRPSSIAPAYPAYPPLRQEDSTSRPGLQPPPRGIGNRIVLVVLLVLVAMAVATAVFLARGGRLKFMPSDAPSVTLSAQPRGDSSARPPSSAKP